MTNEDFFKVISLHFAITFCFMLLIHRFFLTFEKLLLITWIQWNKKLRINASKYLFKRKKILNTAKFSEYYRNSDPFHLFSSKLNHVLLSILTPYYFLISDLSLFVSDFQFLLPFKCLLLYILSSFLLFSL